MSNQPLDNVIRPFEGRPKMGTPEFKQWLKDFHAEHNSPKKTRGRAKAAQRRGIRITAAGKEILEKDS